MSSDANRRYAPSPKLIVYEALGTVFSAEQRDLILQNACRLAGLGAVPDAPNALRMFVEGALFSTLSRRLGISDALDVVAQVRGALELALRDRSASPRPPEIYEAEPDAVAPVQVLVLTEAALVVIMLQDRLGSFAEVVRVRCRDDLEDQLTALTDAPAVVIVDRRHPRQGPAAGSVLAAHCRKTCTIVWWGGGSVDTVLEDGPRFVSIPAGTGIATLAAICRGVSED